MQSVNIVKNFPGGYRLPRLHVRTYSAFTNTTPIGAYRGAGRPEGVYYMERLMDTAAREMGIDPVELRRRNLLRADELPYRAVSKLTYDSGDFPAVLDRALVAADWDGFAERRAASKARGRLRGRGLSYYLEVTAPPNQEMGGIRFGEDGSVTMATGTLDYGQGHRAAFAQVVAAKLGVPFESLRLLQGDSDELIAGGGTGGSRSIMMSGTALLAASDLVIEKGQRLAAHVLEAAEADIEFADGAFTVAGTDRSVGLVELAGKVRAMAAEGAVPEGLPDSLDAELVVEGVPSAFPNGCHLAEVEIDPDTGQVALVRYVAVDDFGTLINPLLVEGQVQGGIAQGAGQALMENAVHDADGQLLSGSFMDYTMPRADTLPFMAFESHPVPATTNPLGAKGCGEAGTSGSMPAVINAVVDALHERTGVLHLDMPATAERVWEALARAG
jgi:carbon-monoxide dehydrogenase large subunit